MSAQVAKRLALAMFAVTVALTIGFIALVVAVTLAASAPGAPFPPRAMAQLRMSSHVWITFLVSAVPLWAFSVLGVMIVSRYPTHAIGWIFCAVGFLVIVDGFTGYYAIYALYVAPGSLPGGLLAAWIQNWTWFVTISLSSVFVPLLFPTGRILSKRWKPAWWLAIGITVAGMGVLAVERRPLTNHLDSFNLNNPFGIAGIGDVTGNFANVLLMVFLASILLAVASLVVRLRHARGLERRQIKWFAYVAIVLGLLFVLQSVLQNVLGISSPSIDMAYNLSSALAGLGLPIAAGLAILRDRLYDIDVIIRRTLIYGTLTTLLAGIYFGLIIGLGGTVRAVFGLSEQQPTILVVSTLAMVVIVRPAQRVVQRLIDLRFYRYKYDAARTLATFGMTVRTETDLSALSERLVLAVQETMQPEHVSLWLRPLEHRA